MLAYIIAYKNRVESTWKVKTGKHFSKNGDKIVGQILLKWDTNVYIWLYTCICYKIIQY